MIKDSHHLIGHALHGSDDPIKKAWSSYLNSLHNPFANGIIDFSQKPNSLSISPDTKQLNLDESLFCIRSKQLSSTYDSSKSSVHIACTTLDQKRRCE
jgi:hypothetical protein